MNEGVQRVVVKNRKERFLDWLGDLLGAEGSIGFELTQLFRSIFYWIIENAFWLGILVLALSALWFLFQQVKERQTEIQRLWGFLLFFLSKRHMMLPVLHTVSSREKYLDEESLGKITKLRQQAREVSLRQNPAQRMGIEGDVSNLLVEIFTKVEKSPSAKNNQIIKTIGKDLEFVDEKLVELQEKYNATASRFNSRYVQSPIGKVLSLFKVRAFPLFSDNS